ncbi:MAG: alpha/beta family hydrolase [Phycisphaeraceae bacterium]
MKQALSIHRDDVTVSAAGVALPGFLALPDGAGGLVIFAHGSGSSRFSRRNQFVADVLNQDGLATLLFDLLTAEEHAVDEQTRAHRFDIGMLARRLTGVVDWAQKQPVMAQQRIGLFGSSTGAAAALISAAQRPEAVTAVVSRGGRPDLAEEALSRVQAHTLLIVGSLDEQVIELNRQAAAQMNSPPRIEIVPGATHLFEEPGTLEQVAQLARDWCKWHLRT